MAEGFVAAGFESDDEPDEVDDEPSDEELLELPPDEFAPSEPDDDVDDVDDEDDAVLRLSFL